MIEHPENHIESFVQSGADWITFHQVFTMVGYIYSALPQAQHGEASAAALILFGIIFIVTMINLYVSKKNTHY